MRRDLLAKLHECLMPFLEDKATVYFNDESYRDIIWGLHLIAIHPTYGSLIIEGGASD
jgi:hypothetical protein